MADTLPPIITLTTDFGYGDHYVAAVKGAILSVAPDARIVDITHAVSAHSPLEAGWILRNALGAFPRFSIHVAVADPGVGTSRRPLVAVSENHRFVGPDNGLFTYVFEIEPPTRIFEITASHYLPERTSSTFHARDIFAPAAAWLARGVDPSNLGDPIEDPVLLETPRPKVMPDGRLRTTVIHVDRFGNIVLNVSRTSMEALMQRLKAGGFRATVADRPIERTCGTYGEAPPGEPFFLFNSSDHLEIAMNQASAANLLKLEPGWQVDLTVVPA